MNVLRQSVSFVMVGGCLVLVDWAVFVLLTALGLATVPANVASRAVGAVLGFCVNGYVTFGDRTTPRLGLRRFARYVAMWVTMTCLSSLLVALVADELTLQMAWLAKPVVEAGLAVASFLLSRHWVYR